MFFLTALDTVCEIMVTQKCDAKDFWRVFRDLEMERRAEEQQLKEQPRECHHETYNVEQEHKGTLKYRNQY